MTKSVYIHIPFCKNICSYCDFSKVLYNTKYTLKYLVALEHEIKDKYHGEEISTLYIGGGTPSSLSTGELKKLFSIIDIFKKTRDIEYTFECNIDDIRDELLEILSNNNVNRLSIGVESFNQKKLKYMDREADYLETEAKIKLCRDFNFNNINIDLIYALPSEKLRDLKQDVSKFIDLNVEHISTYSLIIEDNTRLKLEDAKCISEDLDLKMYNYIIKTLAKSGYNHYEISNFSKEGYESKHNLVYWNNEEYYGFGLGAAGYHDHIRYENTKNLSKYLKNDILSENSIVGTKDSMDYEIILGLRKTKGINIDLFNEKYKTNIFSEYDFETQINNGNVLHIDNYLSIAPEKLYIMNEILIKLI